MHLFIQAMSHNELAKSQRLQPPTVTAPATAPAIASQCRHYRLSPCPSSFRVVLIILLNLIISFSLTHSFRLGNVKREYHRSDSRPRILLQNSQRNSQISLIILSVTERDNESLTDSADDSNDDNSTNINLMLGDNESVVPTDMDSFSQSIQDTSMQLTIKNLVLGESKPAGKSPTDVLKFILKDIPTLRQDAGTMLEMLFPPDKGKDPFDEV